jgi:hypothetical protein
VVIIPDAFGWTLPNTRVMANDIATKGSFQVLVPDFMDGASQSTTFFLTCQKKKKKRKSLTNNTNGKATKHPSGSLTSFSKLSQTGVFATLQKP